MPPIEEYLEYADTLAQDVVNFWASQTLAGNADGLPDDFEDLLDKACQYQTPKSVADMLIKPDRVKTAHQAFAEACKVYREKRHFASA